MTLWDFVQGVRFEQTIELDESEVIVHEDSDSEATPIGQLESTDSS